MNRQRKVLQERKTTFCKERPKRGVNEESEELEERLSFFERQAVLKINARGSEGNVHFILCVSKRTVCELLINVLCVPRSHYADQRKGGNTSSKETLCGQDKMKRQVKEAKRGLLALMMESPERLL